MKNKDLLECTKEIVVAMIEAKYLDATRSTLKDNVSDTIECVFNTLKKLSKQDD